VVCKVQPVVLTVSWLVPSSQDQNFSDVGQQDLLRWASEAVSAWPLLAALLSPDRWLLWLGLLFVFSVYYFPTGIVGRLRAKASS
jgi:ABC-type branched-subunit amino acid transport system permease subunit